MPHWKDLKVKVQEHEEPAAIVYHLAGVLTDTTEAFAFLELVRESLEESSVPYHVIDLSGVPHVTSAGVGIIAAAYTSANRTDKQLALVVTESRIESLLKVVGLWEMVPHFDSVEAALGAAG